MTFDVPPADFDAEVERLRAKGVTFQTFDLEGVEWNDGIAAMGETVKAVWFTDPDGNILNVSTGTP
jgi:catechol 2,3-dioxygenase-like lactoylglutathione lyase family enzyme